MASSVDLPPILFADNDEAVGGATREGDVSEDGVPVEKKTWEKTP